MTKCVVQPFLCVGTTIEVAEMFGKSPDTVYRMAQKRQIQSFMFGGSRCF